jgi:hypothetical protein
MTIAINKYFKIKNGIQFEDGTTATSLSNLIGAKGDTGTAATIVLGTVSTGTTAEVTNTGTSENVYLNFVIPYVPGPKGDAGTAGPQGDTGTSAVFTGGTISGDTTFSSSVTLKGSQLPNSFKYFLLK